jgi:hypothetical protein
MLSLQARSGAGSGQSPAVRSGYGRWNDAETAIGSGRAVHLDIRAGAAIPPRGIVRLGRC